MTYPGQGVQLGGVGLVYLQSLIGVTVAMNDIILCSP